jgi:hydroxymethylbilane synthase
MINGQVDMHSMKDVPPHRWYCSSCSSERATTLDILVHKGNVDFLNDSEIVIPVTTSGAMV